MTNRAPEVDRNTWIVAPASTRDLLPDHYEILEVDGYVFSRCSDGRFSEDRCMVVHSNYVLLIDGVILNKDELQEETCHTSIAPLISGLLDDCGIQAALARLRGVFSGAILDRARGVLHAFGNQTGESAAFEYSGTLSPLLSNSFDLIMRVLRFGGTRATFDEHAAQVMLTYGFMIDDHTFAQEIKRVGPGRVLSIDLVRGESETSTYWQLSIDTPCKVSTIESAVGELDRLFRQAVTRCFNKDLEYGYRRHLVDMSGGMDARMVNVVARDLGYTSITNVTYSESGSDDNRYAVQLATLLGNDCLYHPMDQGRSVLNPEENLRMNSGMAFYAGITGGAFVLRSLNFAEFGLEHTGMMGGAVVGTSATSSTRRSPAPGTGAYTHSNIYPPDLDADDEELFTMNTLEFRGSSSTHLLRQHFTFAVSPYADVDVLDFMFSLPLEWRLNQRLLILWARSRYPLALTVPTTRILPFRTDPVRSVTLMGKRTIRALSRRGRSWFERRGLPGVSALFRYGNAMNPLDHWYAVNPDFRNLVTDSGERAAKLPVDDATRMSLKRSFVRGSTIFEKLLAVTVVTMHSTYFADAEEQLFL